jgi:hypothetical protein
LFRLPLNGKSDSFRTRRPGRGRISIVEKWMIVGWRCAAAPGKAEKVDRKDNGAVISTLHFSEFQQWRHGPFMPRSLHHARASPRASDPYSKTPRSLRPYTASSASRIAFSTRILFRRHNLTPPQRRANLAISTGANGSESQCLEKTREFIIGDL